MTTPLSSAAPQDCPVQLELPPHPEVPPAAPDLPLYARADGWLSRLTAELHRMSSHRDDETAILALALHDELRSASPAITAQRFEPVYHRTYERAHTPGDPARREWQHVYLLACHAYEALVWAWRLRVLSRADASEGRSALSALGGESPNREGAAP